MQRKQVCVSALLAVGLALFTMSPSSAQQAGKPLAQAGKSGEQSKPAARGEGVAAVVNDQIVSTFDVRQRAALMLASSGIPPTQEAIGQVRGQALRALIDEYIQVQEATERKIKAEDDEVDAALERIAKSNKMTVPQFGKQLRESGAGVETLRKQLRAEIMWRRLISARYGSRVRISNDEINDTLEMIKSNASKPQYRLAEILLLADNEDEFKEANKAAGRMLTEMRSGRVSFSAVARQVSGAPSAAAGGDLGWLSEGELKPEVAAAARTLKPGQISQPIRTEFGVLMVGLRERKDGIDPSRAMKVRLRQVTAPLSSRAALDRAKSRVRGCDTLGNVLKSVPDASVIDLGDMIEADLADNLKAKVVETSAGSASGFIEGNGTISTIVVCARGSDGGIVPSREEIEDRLYEQEMGMLSQRYLMDLRRESTIIMR